MHAHGSNTLKTSSLSVTRLVPKAKGPKSVASSAVAMLIRICKSCTSTGVRYHTDILRVEPVAATDRWVVGRPVRKTGFGPFEKPSAPAFPVYAEIRALC